MTKLKRDEALVKAMDACVEHARDLLSSAQAVMLAGHPNIAYHLAALALEEIGRRALLGVQAVSHKRKLIFKLGSWTPPTILRSASKYSLKPP